MLHNFKYSNATLRQIYLLKKFNMTKCKFSVGKYERMKKSEEETAKQTWTSILSVKRFTQISTQPIVPAIHLAVGLPINKLFEVRIRGTIDRQILVQRWCTFVWYLFLSSYRTLRALLMLPRSLFDLFECHKKQNIEMPESICDKYCRIDKGIFWPPFTNLTLSEWQPRTWKIFSLY